VSSREDFLTSPDIATLRDVSMLKLLFPRETETSTARIEQSYALAAAAEQRFRALAEVAAVPCDWQVAEGDAAEVLSVAARYHDLTIVEQTDLVSDEIGFDVPETCVLSSGRPVLIVPNAGRFDQIGRSIVVAWNGSRQAAAALHGALPFVARAERVVVIQGRGRASYPSVTRWPALDLTRAISSHGVAVSVEPIGVEDGDAGSAILAAAAREAADLIVMGAYGRSWMSEWIMGGATRHVLSHMNVPVLMAH
jgi:nucleotide-binding universal stress UspA family protein